MNFWQLYSHLLFRYTDNQRAQDSINLTLFYWGIHGWIVYVVVGLLLAFVGCRQQLPMTMRSCLYPLIGDKINGWMGDMTDFVSVFCAMFGVCTSLGIGVMQLNAGVHRLNDSFEISTTNQIIIIWCVTACATASVVIGLEGWNPTFKWDLSHPGSLYHVDGVFPGWSLALPECACSEH